MILTWLVLALVFVPKCHANLPPVFTQDMNNLVISESTPVGTQIYTLEAADPENSPLRYDLQGTDVLKVDHQTGAVTVIKPLDYESNSTLQLVVSVEDQVQGGRNNVVEETVTVIVQDENDNPPEFQSSLYEVEVLEDAQLGTTLLTVDVVDRDTVGESIEVTCLNSLDNIDACDVFHIQAIDSNVNAYTGAVVLGRKLNYSLEESYMFTLLASDGALTSTADVLVMVKDVQDTPPRFLSNLTAELPEDVPINTLVFTVEAEDGDRGSPRNVVYDLVNNPMDYFTLDPTSGQLLTARPLDKEAIPQGLLTFDIRASELVNGHKSSDPSTVATATATVRVLDVNDEPPRFNKREYFVQIPEDIMEGSELPGLDMTVTDPDEGDNSAFVLELNDISGAFSIEPKMAVGSTNVTIRVKHSSLDYEDPNQRKFIILAVAREVYTDKKLSSTSTITVSVVDVNDNPPTFDQDSYTATVSELATPGSPVVTITARDRDTGKFGENGLVYKLTGSGADLFAVNNRTGTVTVNICSTSGVQPCLDYEAKSEYPLQFVATDDDGKGQTTAVPLKITLTDSNDNAPVFSQSTYKVFVNEGATRFDPAPIIDARDEDQTSHLTYAIIAGNDNDLFKIDPDTGKLKIAGNKGLEINNDTDNVVSLTVLATDGKYTATSLVNITVLDVNDHAPQFQQQDYIVDVLEDVPLHTSIAQLQATDEDTGDNALISYTIKGSYGDFNVDSSGTVHVTSKLDYDRRNTYNIEVLAVDHGQPPLTGSTSLTVKIINTNDKLPYFVPATQKADVMEDALVGTVVHTLVAMDPDVTSQALNFAATEPITALDKHGVEVAGQEFKRFFTVDKDTGKVVVASPLLRDRAAEVRIPVLVTDITAPFVQQGEGLLVVTIQDINDSPPSFVPPWTQDHPEYHLEIKEELPVGTIVATYRAFDEDSDISGYTINPPSDYFQINQGTGIVQIQKIIDYEQTKELNFTVWAFDSGLPQLNVSALIHVTVINLNDHDPVFTHAMYNVSIDENSPSGTTLIQVKAIDKDSGDYGLVDYQLVGGYSENFHIDPTGVITVANSSFLDHEAIKDLELEVVASDRAPVNLRRSSTASVYISINDLNDNAPVFADQAYEVNVMEDVRLNPPVPLIQLNATDQDSGINGNIHYSIVSGNDNDVFLIGMDTGTLYAHKSLLGLTKTFNLTVEARDGAGNGDKFDRTNVKVHVVNVNDHSPEFVVPFASNATVDVLETSATKGFVVLTVKATDKDQGENGRITYHFKVNDQLVQDTDTFVIDEHTGEVRLKRDLDREERSKYQLTLIVRDHGYPKFLQNERDLTVLIVDENDNRPEFSSKLYWFNLTENNEQNVLIGHIQALDRDEGKHATVYYYILAGDDGFKLDRATGDLYAVKSFDREVQGQYNLTVIANNDPDFYITKKEVEEMEQLGVLEDKSIAHVVVGILDLNDNEPIFDRMVYYAGVNVMSPVNQFVVNVSAVDPDEGINGSLSYYIKASNLYKYHSTTSSGSIIPSPFNITQNGSITTATLLSENNQHRFVVDVIAREEGFPEREAHAQAHIWVYEPEQLIRVILSRPKEEVEGEKKELVSELSNATKFQIIVDEIRKHPNGDWSDMYILAVDSANNIVAVPDVLKVIDAEYDFLKDYYAGFAIENVVPALVQDKEEAFDPALAALIALMIVLFVGVVSFIVVCCCLRHWVISPTDDLKKKDALIKKAIIDDLTTTENPLWIEQKLKLYEEQELTMQVFNEPDMVRRSSDLPEDNTYATIQHPHRRQQSTVPMSDDLGEYATLSRIANQGGSANSSLRDTPNYYEAAMGFQGSTFQVPDRLSDTTSEFGSIRGQPSKLGRDYVTELI